MALMENIYSRLKGQASWSFLSIDTSSPYDDHKVLANGSPETREYMCIGVMEDTEVGQQSDIVTLVFGGWRLRTRDPETGSGQVSQDSSIYRI